MTYWFSKTIWLLVLFHRDNDEYFHKIVMIMWERWPFSSLLGGKSCSNMERSTGPRSALYVRPELFTCCKRLWYIQLFPKNFCTCCKTLHNLHFSSVEKLRFRFGNIWNSFPNIPKGTKMESGHKDCSANVTTTFVCDKFPIFYLIQWLPKNWIVFKLRHGWNKSHVSTNDIYIDV